MEKWIYAKPQLVVSCIFFNTRYSVFLKLSVCRGVKEF